MGRPKQADASLKTSGRIIQDNQTYHPRQADVSFDTNGRIRRLEMMFLPLGCNNLLSKQFLVFPLKVWSEHTLAKVVEYFLSCPEPTAREFTLIRMYLTIVHHPMRINQFLLPLALEDIRLQLLGIFHLDSQLFPHLTLKRHANVFAQIHMTSTRRIPFARLYVLPFRSSLQIEFALAVEHMEMNHRMQNLASAVRLSPTYRSQD